MSRELVHIFGPLSIQSFGLIIAIGLALFTWLVKRHPRRKKLMNVQQFSEVLLIGVISGIVGGRLLYVMEEFHAMESFWDAISFWEGGFSILGSLIAVPIAATIYLKKNKIPILPFLDLVALYGPLLQSISRIGCFVAGCCYGKVCSLPWAITYTASNSMAPTHMPLHPTQLYSSAILFFIFLFMRFVASKWCTIPGQLIALYLFLASAERFTVDFWRANRELFGSRHLAFFSVHQWLALGIGIVTMLTFAGLTIRSKQIKQ